MSHRRLGRPRQFTPARSNGSSGWGNPGGAICQVGVSPSGRRFCPCRRAISPGTSDKATYRLAAETLRSGPSRSSGDIFHKCEECGRSRDVRSRRISRHLSPSESARDLAAMPPDVRLGPGQKGSSAPERSHGPLYATCPRLHVEPVVGSSQLSLVGHVVTALRTVGVCYRSGGTLPSGHWSREDDVRRAGILRMQPQLRSCSLLAQRLIACDAEQEDAICSR